MKNTYMFGVANFKAHWSVSLSNTKTDKNFVIQQNKCKVPNEPKNELRLI